MEKLAIFLVYLSNVEKNHIGSRLNQLHRLHACIQLLQHT